MPPPEGTSCAQYAAALDAAVRRLADDPDLRGDAVVTELRALRPRLEAPLVVAVAGDFGVGKSTLLDALVGPGLLPAGGRVPPGCLGFVRHGAGPSVEVQYAGGRRRSFDGERWRRVVDPAGLERRELTGAERVELVLAHEFLRALTLVDTPGLRAPDARDLEVTERVLEVADALVWVTPAPEPLGAGELAVLRRHGRYHGRALCVLNRVGDLADPRRELPLRVEQVRRAAPELFVAVVPVDARGGSGGGAELLEQALRGHLVARRDELKVKSVGAAARAVLTRRRESFDAGLEDARGRTERIAGAKRRLDAQVAAHGDAMAKLWERTAGQLRRAQEELVGMVLAELREWTDQVPFQKRKPGLLTDDYFVEWKRTTSWYWPLERVEAAEKLLRDKAARPLTAFADEGGGLVERAMEDYARGLRELAEAAQEEVAGLDAIAGQAELFARYANQHWRKLNAYFWGGIKCGGPRGMCGWMFLEKQSRRHGKEEVVALVERWVPVARVLELGGKYLAEYREELEARHQSWATDCARATLESMVPPPPKGALEALAAAARDL